MTTPPPQPSEPPTLMIIAGEVSGDERAAALVSALRQEAPGLTFFGIGGPRMRAAGVDTLQDIADMAVMGVTEVLRRYGFFRRVFNRMLHEAKLRRPAAVILVDYPGFNLRFARKAHAMGIKIIYYVCPQVWAWHQSRIPHMAKIIDRLITIFPFEARYFKGTNLRVDFAGHPLVDETARDWDSPAVHLPWAGGPNVALLPGSREHEIRRLLPDLLATAREIERVLPTASFLIPTPDEATRTQVETLRATLPAGPTHCTVIAGQTRQVLRQARAAIVASGTATLEASLMLCPMVIVYRVSPLTYFMAKHLVRIPHIGIVNIVAGNEICPEFIQDAVKPKPLAAAVLRLLTDDPHRESVRTGLQRVNHALGAGGAAARAAASVIEELRR